MTAEKLPVTVPEPTAILPTVEDIHARMVRLASQGGLARAARRKAVGDLRCTQVGFQQLIAATWSHEGKKLWNNLCRFAKSDDIKEAIPALTLVLAYTFGKPIENKNIAVHNVQPGSDEHKAAWLRQVAAQVLALPEPIEVIDISEVTTTVEPVVSDVPLEYD